MIERLNRVLRRLGHEPRLDELRDILWLAQHLPPAQDLPASATSQPETSKTATSQGRTKATVADVTKHTAQAQETRRVLESAPGPSETPVYAGTGAGDYRRAQRVRLPGPPPLPEEMKLGRALRPLGRRRPSATLNVLDERATAEHIAETGLPLVIMSPSWERWFDLVLAVEHTPSLAAWRPAVNRFQCLLERCGNFRSVTRIAIQSGDGKFNIYARDGAQLSPSSFYERRARRLFLIVSDCTSEAWHEGSAGALLELMGNHLPTAVAQLLPAALWPNTAVGFAEFRVGAVEPGATNARLRLRKPDWAEGEPGVVAPVFPLEPAPMAVWARMVMAAGDTWSPAALLPMPDETLATKASLLTTRTTDAEERVSVFRAATLGDAQRLAAYFSVVKPLTLPVMRMVQRAMLPETGPVALAQVFLGGILQAVNAGASNTDESVEYEFHAGVRDLLCAGVMRSEFFQVNLALQDYILRQIGQPFSFFAFLEDRLGEEEIAPAALPFARFAREIADRFRAPGAPPREDGPHLRYVEERVFAPGLTVRAEASLPAAGERLVWSPDGKRLAVLHGTGVEVLHARSLRTLVRERESPLQAVVLAHDNDMATLEPLVQKLERTIEHRTGRPWSFIMNRLAVPDGLAKFETYPIRASLDYTLRQIKNPTKASSPRDDIQQPAVIVLALTQAIDPGSLAQRTDFLHYHLPAVSYESSVRILALPFELNWANINSEALAGNWAGILNRPIASSETAQAIEAFSDVLVDNQLPAPEGSIVGMGWRTGNEIPETMRVRSGGSESVLVSPEATVPILYPSYAAEDIVECDWSNGGVLISDRKGSVRLLLNGKENQTQVVAEHGARMSGDAANVRWAPNGRDYCSVGRLGQVWWGTLDHPSTKPGAP